MENFIIIAILAVIVFAAGRYVYKEKKRGVKCVGCPSGCSCSTQGCSASGCGCNCQQGTE